MKAQIKKVATILNEASKVSAFVWNHPANNNRKLLQLAKAMNFQLRARAFNYRPQVLVGTSAKIWVDLHRTSSTKALYANPPDWPEMKVWQEFLKLGDLFIDVGANVGAYSVLAASLGAEVIAIEAAPDTFELLEENIDLNGFKDVTLLNAAASNFIGETKFTKGFDSVNRISDDGTDTVKTVTIDSIIGDKKVKGMKVDVEGFELNVLQGAKIALQEQRISLLQLEWNDASFDALGTNRDPAESLLRDFSYEILRPNQLGHLRLDHKHEGISDIFAAPKGMFSSI